MQFKSKRPEPPKAGDMMTLVSTRIVQIHNEKPAANEPKHGKLDYLAGSPKKKPKKPAPAQKRIVEKRQLSIGKYLGNGKQLTAFVMLDPDEVSQEKAANE